MTRVITAIARLANDRPWAVLAAVVAVLVAIVGLAVLGAWSLIFHAEPSEWFTFAAIVLAVMASSNRD